jgi:ligand-binding sensor domain-containing protein
MAHHHRRILVGFLVWSALGAASVVPAAELRASAPYLVDVWEAEDGLPGSSVTAIVQTRDGYLWLGTLYGLVRFDGVRFTVFDKSNTPGLESNRILYLFEDSQGNLWVGTETAGVVLVKEGQVTNLGIGRGARERRLVAACEDPKGAVWLYTADGQLWHYDHGTTNVFLVAGESFSWYRTIAAEESGLLWIGTDWRLLAINPAVSTAPGQVPVEQELPVAKLDYLLASRQGGHWRLAGGRVQKWETTRLERDWGMYPWARAPARIGKAICWSELKEPGCSGSTPTAKCHVSPRTKVCPTTTFLPCWWIARGVSGWERMEGA